MGSGPCSRGAFAVILASIFTYGTLAVAADAELKQTPFWESVQSDVDVSGMVVVGLTSSGLVSGRDLSNINLSPSAAPAGSDVCLTVQSRDGVYIARNTYVLPASADGKPIRLPYDKSKELKLVQAYPEKQLGISVAKGDCANPANRLLKPQGAGGTAKPGVDLMINGMGATDVFYSFPGTDLSGVCDALRDGRTTVFDFWCHIPELPQSAAQDLEITIARERYGRELPPASVTLAVDE